MPENADIHGRLTPAAGIKAALGVQTAIAGGITIPERVTPAQYTGDYSITPSDEAQVLSTMDLYLTDNITVQPIPNNYGRIGWNGSILTVT